MTAVSWSNASIVAGAIALSLATSAGCARAVPPHSTTAALYRDLQRLVTLTEAGGWEIDRIEVEQLLPDALMSVCSVAPERRAELLAWIDARIEAGGGDVRALYVARGNKLDEVEDELELARVRMVLAASIEAADADCPFWIQHQEPFRGRQISDDRWQLSFGGGGKGIFTVQDGEVDLNFGGAGRLMFGRTFGDRWSVLAGIEGGASASFPRDEGDGGDRGSLVLGFDVAVPVVARYRLVNTYLEGEVGYLQHFTEDDRDGDPGIRVGFSFGGRAARRKAFLPGAVFGVSYERTFPDEDGEPALHLIKLGFRVAIDVDL
jgi:hypothetical protein